MRTEHAEPKSTGAARGGNAGAVQTHAVQHQCHAWVESEPGASPGLACNAPWQTAPVESGRGIAADAAATPARNAWTTTSQTAMIATKRNGCAAGRVGTGRLSHPTLSQPIFHRHLRREDATAWPTVNRL